MKRQNEPAARLHLGVDELVRKELQRTRENDTRVVARLNAADEDRALADGLRVLKTSKLDE